MAEIKNYLDEKNKRYPRRENEPEFETEYRRHKRMRLTGWLILLCLLAGGFLAVYFYFRDKIFTGYDVVNTVEREKVDSATDVSLGTSIMTYSQDGAHCVDLKGNLTWNQSYEIQDLRLALCRNMSAIYGYNGHSIYVQSSEGQVGEIQTHLPIKHLAVSASGRTTVVLEDTDVIWMNTFEAGGQNIYEGQFHMSQSGYPCAISLSPDGELLAVSFIFIEEGNVVSNVAFYNYGPVGENQSDQLVSTFTYSDMVIPEIHFMNDSTAFAVGDNRLMIYSGAQVPTTKTEFLLDRKVKAVYYNEKYVGLIFGSDQAESKYMLKIFDTSGELAAEHYFDMDYLGMFFENGAFGLYNETDCVIYTMSGKCRYEGKFDKNISLMIPTDTPYRYRIVTDTSIDTIQLK